MDRAAAHAKPAEETLFRDGFGDRVLTRDAFGRPVHESLLLRHDLTSIPSFEFALHQRLTRLEAFDHPAFVPLLRLDRLSGQLTTLNLVSEFTGGVRLARLLQSAERESVAGTDERVLGIVRDLLEAVEALHLFGEDLFHGALSPERVVMAGGRACLADYCLGGAVEQLRFSPERYWKELRVAVPSDGGLARFGRDTDVVQIGMIALALFASRPLTDVECVGSLEELLARMSVAPPIDLWLRQTLREGVPQQFVDASHARRAFEDAVSRAGVVLPPAAPRSPGRRPAGSLRSPAARVSSASSAQPRSPALMPPAAKSKAAARQTMFRGAPPQPHGEPRAGVRIPLTDQLRTAIQLGLLAVALAGAFSAAQYLPPPSILFPKTGTLAIDSNPRGAALFVDRQPRGVTPAEMTLKTGRHEVEIRTAGASRAFTIYVSGSEPVSQFIELDRQRGSRRSAR